MALITMPSSPGFTRSEWGMTSAVAVSESGFTGASKTQAYGMRKWNAVLTLPPMKRSQAAAWQAFFLKLRGRENTFLLGDPDAKTIIGTATSASVAAAGAIGDDTVTLDIGVGKTLNAGSYIQLGTGASSRLYMVVDDNTGNASGDAQCDIEPTLKSAITTSTTVTLTNPKGVFRMDDNDLRWSADHISTYGMTFSCSEVV